MAPCERNSLAEDEGFAAASACAAMPVMRSTTVREEVEGLAAVASYATSRCDLPWMTDVAKGFTYPLLLPPLPPETRDASRSSSAWATWGGGGFSNIFARHGGGSRRKDASASDIHRDRQSQLAAAIEESTAERVTRVQKQLVREAPRSAPVLTPTGSIGLPQDWDPDWDGEGEDKARSASPPREHFETMAVGRPRSRTSSCSGSRSPRNRTISLPDDFFEEARLDLPDSVSGPASAWHSAQSRPAALTLTSTAGMLANMDEALFQFRAASEQAAPVPELKDQNDDTVSGKAFAREESLKKAADAELSRTLLRLSVWEEAKLSRTQELDARAKESRKAAPSSAAPSSSAFAGGVASSGAFAAGVASSGAFVGAIGSSGAFAGSVASASVSPLLPQMTPATGSSPIQPVQPLVRQPLPASSVVPVSSPFLSQSKAASPVSQVPAASPAVQVPAAIASTTSAAATPATSTLVTSSQEQSMGHLEFHAHLIKKLRAAEAVVAKIKSQDAEKTFRNQMRQAINKKVTQICANGRKIQECSQALCDLLGSMSQEPSAERRQFAEYMVAYRLADEAEVGIKSSAKAAWPIAYVCTQIFNQFPSVEELFQGFIHTNCPYVTADYADAQAGQRTGQRTGESYGDFVDRMLGYHRLWLAVTVIQDELSVVWLWLARTLNAGGGFPIAASLLHCTLEVAGCAAQGRYKQQFAKLVSYIQGQYIPELEELRGRTKGEEADRLRASQSRLQVWLKTFAAKGAQQPDGQRIEAQEESELNPNI